MEHNFAVNIATVKRLSEEMKVESENLKAIVNNLIRITNEMETFFDTPTAKVLKEGLIRYLNNAKRPCENLKDLSEKIKIFSENYNNLYKKTGQSVGDGV